MSSIKIECNPYTKEVKYFWKTDGDGEQWEDLSLNKSSPFSKSNSHYKEFAQATIAHKAYKILKMINDKYNTGNSGIEILFEGTQDDLYEIQSVLETYYKDSGMTCNRGEKYILPAREVMPQIEQIYSSLETVLSENGDDEIRELVAKYSDAVKPEISLCVMGLYSSGKSSFINSLIGKEILPSASDPTTAKIYKINSDDCTWLQFKFEGVVYRINFYDSDWKINTSPDADIISRIKEKISALHNEEAMLYTALTVLNEHAIEEGNKRQAKFVQLAGDESKINDYLEKNSIPSLIEQNMIEEYHLDDLIEIGVQFNDNTLLPINEFKFVIFDTPGSNSAMHREHVETLKKSLNDRTNGLPIFVTTADTLDSTDNAPVIDMIEKMGDALDGTSMMIVVNKADEKTKSSLEQKRSKADELKVTSWKPRRIYFISSIVSLGQKIENPLIPESWMDSEYADIYYSNYKKFDESDERSLLQLYKYDILSHNVEESLNKIAEQKDGTEKILWNTGIRSIEREIGAFCEKFALYNKCVQAKKYLKGAIDKLNKKISKMKNLIDKTEEEIQSESDKVTNELMNSIEKKIDSEKKDIDTRFPKKVVEPNVALYLDKNRITNIINGAISEAKNNPRKWREDGWFKGIENSTNYVNYVNDIVSSKFEADLDNYSQDMNTKCDSFWKEETQKLKSKLLKIVFEAKNLTEEQKKIAQECVMQAGIINNSHRKFEFQEGKGIKKKQILWFKWDDVDESMAAKKYESDLDDVLQRKNKGLVLDNNNEFEEWKKKLKNTLREKMSQLNPKVIELNRILEYYQELNENLEIN